MDLSAAFDLRVVVLKELANGPLDTLLDTLEGEGEHKPSDDDDSFLASDDVVSDPDIVSIVAEKEYCNSAIELLVAVEQAMPKIEEMTKSKTLSDVTEALQFFSRAVNFNIKGAGKSLRDAFSLIWHHDEAVRAECMSAFNSVFLTDGAASHAQPLPAPEVASNLAGLVQHCGSSELASLEKIVGDLFKVDGNCLVIQSLWSKILTLHREEPSAEKSKELGSFVKVIGVIAKCCPDVMTAPKIRLVTSLLSELSKAAPDCSLISAAAQCMQTAPGYLSGKADADTVEALSEAASCLRDIVLGFWCPDTEKDTRNWFQACEEALHALFHTHPSPDKVLSSIFVPLYADLASTLSNVDGRATTTSSKLARVLFVLGQGAICSLVFTEKIASVAKKAGEEQQKAECRVSEQTKAHHNVSDAMEEEMGLVAAADAEHERLYNLVIEKQLVCDNVLGKFHPLIAYVVANESGTFSHPLLRETAILALCRFMSVSSQLCELYLPLLFTIVERELSEAVRTTVMIAVGDLAFRFPNSLEPWTANMYARLSDENVLVRYNTLMTLTHLILNDMIKVKGQVSHMVLCLNDSNEKVRDLACLFFTELSKRSNNPVYNLLGDIISILSRGSTEEAAPVADEMTRIRVLSEKEFQDTMTFLLKFVSKDKQADSLLERLLVRIGLATDLAQKRNLAFCISQLPVTEKGVKKMIEMIKLFKDALYDEFVFESFKQCLAKAKKTNPFAKKASDPSPEGAPDSTESMQAGASSVVTIKSVTDEFEYIMGIIKNAADGLTTEEIDFDTLIASVSKSSVKDENSNSGPTVKKNVKKSSKKPTGKSVVVAAKKKGKKMQWSDEEDDDDELEDDVSDSEMVAAPVKSRQPLKSVN